MSDKLVDNSQVMWRLAQYKAAHPDVMIAREWRARIPSPRGTQDVICGTLQELLDKLEMIASLPASGRRGPGRGES